VLEVVFDEIEALAGSDPCAVEVKAVDENEDGRLEPGG
jgi:hypothetical protein